MTNFNNPITACGKFLVYGLHDSNMVFHIGRRDTIIRHRIAAIDWGLASRAVSYIFCHSNGKVTYRNMSSTARRVSIILLLLGEMGIYFEY